MNTVQIFKNALSLVWHYRALWLFGFLLGLTVNDALWLGLVRDGEEVILQYKIILPNSSTIYFQGEGVMIDFHSPGSPIVEIEDLHPVWYRDLAEGLTLDDVWAFLISIGIVLLIHTIIAILLSSTSKALLIRMVDEYGHSEKMIAVRQGLLATGLEPCRLEAVPDRPGSHSTGDSDFDYHIYTGSIPIYPLWA